MAGAGGVRVFVAGGSGVIGKRLIPKLVQDGYQVTAMTQSPEKTDQLRALGADPVVVDAFDRSALQEAVVHARPDVVVHQLSALANLNDFKHFDREFALTNRLRTDGTDNLLHAAEAAGASRFIAQSYGSWSYERTGAERKTEADPLD